MAVDATRLELDCHKCDDQLKKERGCCGNGLVPFDVDGDRIFECPLKLVSRASWQYVQAYSFYKKNLLPNGTIYRAESQKYIEAMFVIDKHVSLIEQEGIKKTKR